MDGGVPARQRLELEGGWEGSRAAPLYKELPSWNAPELEELEGALEGSWKPFPGAWGWGGKHPRHTQTSQTKSDSRSGIFR